MSRAPAGDRLGRLLAIVPWVASQDGPMLVDVCARFGVAEAELLADLDLLFLCGVHPFTPDTLIEVDVADGRVWIRFAEYFRRPLRLTPSEGLALLSACSALLALPGGDPGGVLARALGKLQTVLAIDGDEPGGAEVVDVEVGTAPEGVLDALDVAVRESRKVEIDYYSFGRDGRSERVVQPWRVFASGGQWYLRGLCEVAAGDRLFRLDRMREVRVLDDHFHPPPPTAAHLKLFEPAAGTPLVVLDLGPGATWIAERYPHEGVEALGDGRLRITLRAAGRAWLERLLLCGGPDVSLVEGDHSIGPSAARRLLGRYGPA